MLFQEEMELNEHGVVMKILVPWYVPILRQGAMKIVGAFIEKR